MQVEKKQISDTKVQLLITAEIDELNQAKQQAIRQLGRDVRVQGFRDGKVPPAIAEKQIDPSSLQSRVLDIVINQIYGQAVVQEHMRPVSQPEVSIKKFVPYTDLQIELDVEVLGPVKLPDYTKIKLTPKPVTITDKDVAEVIEALRIRAADKQEVARAAAKDDEVLIDFAGTDAESGDPIQGADGKDYPLLLGSDSFIPGFEDNILGLTAGQDKLFTLTFPKDYGVKTLQKRKVTFKVIVKSVSELTKPKVDDAFAAKVGPFKTLAELKADIKKQLTAERQNEADRNFENELVEKIVEQSLVTVPQALIDEEAERLETEERRNLVYRGQTWQEHLASEGLTEAEHRDQKRPQAELRIRTGLVLSEIAEKEKLSVSPEELEIRLQILKGQYQDKQMQAELDKPENQRDIQSRLLTEKTLTKLKSYATK